MSTAKEMALLELDELRGRLERLRAFMCDSETEPSAQFMRLSNTQQMLLRFQMYAMSLYEDVLDERLRNWEE